MIVVVADSFLVWSVRSLIPQDRVRFVRNHLRRGARFSGGVSAPDDAVDDMPDTRRRTSPADVDVARFTDFYLRHDGVFLLRLIAHNTNGITTTEIARELWDLWIDRQQPQPQTLHPTHHKALEANETSPLYDRRAVD